MNDQVEMARPEDSTRYVHPVPADQVAEWRTHGWVLKSEAEDFRAAAAEAAAAADAGAGATDEAAQ
jgi:hypothetical protein